MAVERTLAIIKPDAVGRGLTADILSRIHAAKFHIIAIKSLRLGEEAGRRILRRSPRTAVFRRADRLHERAEKQWSWSSKRKTQSRNGATRWAPPIPRKPRPARFARNSAKAFSTIARTVRSARRPAAFEIGYFFSGAELA